MPLVIHGKDNDVGNLKVKLSRQRERERVETFPSKRLPEIARHREFWGGMEETKSTRNNFHMESVSLSLFLPLSLSFLPHDIGIPLKRTAF